MYTRMYTDVCLLLTNNQYFAFVKKNNQRINKFLFRKKLNLKIFVNTNKMTNFET